MHQAAEQEVMVEALYRTSLSIQASLDSHLRPLHLSFARWNVLRALAVGGPMSIRLVADHTGLHRTTVSSLLRTLERGGHVRIGDDDDDRRRSQISLTTAGLLLFETGARAMETVDWAPFVRTITAGLIAPSTGRRHGGGRAS
jgi:DNA-binding MarR family transcriptional regulator